MSQTFKRIALVAVAALSLGGLTAVSSNAAAPFSDTLADTAAGVTTSTTVNTSVYDTFTASFFAAGDSTTNFETLTVTRTVTDSTDAGFYSLTSASDSVTVVDSSTVKLRPGGTFASGVVTGKVVLKFTPATPGTYTFKATPALNGATAAASAVTWTIVVAAPTVKSSVAFISGDITNLDTSASPTTWSDSTTAGLLASKSGANAVAKILVAQFAGADSSTDVISTSYSQSMSIAVSSGPGLLSTSGTPGAAALASSISVLAGTTTTPGEAKKAVYLYPNGTAGISTITITVNGVTVATKTFNFYGSLASFGGKVNSLLIPVSDSGTITVTGADAAGVAVAAGTTNYAFSSDTTVATVPSTAIPSGDNLDTVTVTGVKAGTATITVANASTLAAATITKTFTVTVAPTAVKTVTIALDKAAYTPGEKITVTVTALDSTGALIADSYAKTLFTSDKGMVSSVALTTPTWDSNTGTAIGNASSTTRMALSGGKATFTAYAPTYGDITITATDVNGVAITSATSTVTNVAADLAQAAIDAAQEATDAANAAYDAANNAMDSADAATAAAQEASDNAAAALAAVTELATTVASLVAKVNAIATTLAKIAKKVKA